MMAVKSSASFRRVVLALDPSADYVAAVREAAALAARLGAELSAVFVEDRALLGAAAHPFVRCFSAGAVRWREFGVADMEGAYRALAEKARHATEMAARSRRLHWSFEIVRGEIETSALEAAGETDLVVLGAGMDRLRASAARTKLAWRRMARTRRSVLILRPEEIVTPRIVVLYDGTDGAGRALQAARHLGDPGNLRVVLVAKDEVAARRLENQARELLGDAASEAEFISLPGLGAEGLRRFAARIGAGLLVLADDSEMLGEEAAARELEQCPCRVLVMR
jgi:nucleotide-binding universal stress UspA family protein